MKSAWSSLGKAAAGFAVLLLLSFGLCGIGAVTARANRLPMAGWLGFRGLVAGALGLLICAAAAVVLAIVTAVRKPPPG